MTITDLAKRRAADRFNEAMKTTAVADVFGAKSFLIGEHVIDVRASVHAPGSLLDWLVEALRGGAK